MIHFEGKETETWCVVKCIIQYSSCVVVEAEFRPSAFSLPQFPLLLQGPVSLSDVTFIYSQIKSGTHYMMKYRILNPPPPKISVLPTNKRNL